MVIPDMFVPEFESGLKCCVSLVLFAKFGMCCGQCCEFCNFVKCRSEIWTAEKRVRLRRGAANLRGRLIQSAGLKVSKLLSEYRTIIDVIFLLTASDDCLCTSGFGLSHITEALQTGSGLFSVPEFPDEGVSMQRCMTSDTVLNG